MARGRGRTGVRKSRKRAPTRRADIRQLHQAVSFRPVRVRKLPRDPPVTNQHVEKVIRLPIRFMIDSSATESGFIGSPGADFDIPTFITKRGANLKTPDTVILSPKLLTACFTNITGMTSDIGKSLDVAFKKVIFWGPSMGGNITTPSSIDFAFDLGTYTSGINLADIGTSIHRPVVGVTVPFTHWMESSSIAGIMKFQWDSGNVASTSAFPDGRYEIGVAHITMIGRYAQEA